MQEIRTGHGEQRGETYVLSDGFIEEVGESGVQRFVAIMAQAEQYATDHTEEEVAAFLRDRLDGTDLERPGHSYDITASLLRGSHGRFTIMTNTGRVLHGGEA